MSIGVLKIGVLFWPDDDDDEVYRCPEHQNPSLNATKPKFFTPYVSPAKQGLCNLCIEAQTVVAVTCAHVAAQSAQEALRMQR